MLWNVTGAVGLPTVGSRFCRIPDRALPTLRYRYESSTAKFDDARYDAPACSAQARLVCVPVSAQPPPLAITLVSRKCSMVLKATPTPAPMNGVIDHQVPRSI